MGFDILVSILAKRISSIFNKNLIKTSHFILVCSLIVPGILRSVTTTAQNLPKGLQAVLKGKDDIPEIASECSGSRVIYSIIPNPDFEAHSRIPDKYAQLSYALDWVDATNASPDYFSKYGFLGPAGGIGSTPLPPNGSDFFVGTLGNVNNGAYYEYMGTCLLSPLRRDQAYTLEMLVGAASGDYKYGGSYKGDLVLLGIPSCADFPISGQDNKEDEYEVISRVNVDIPGNTWLTEPVAMEFTPQKNYEAILLGVGLGGPENSYILFDGLSLSQTNQVDFFNISGSLQEKDLVISISTPPIGDSYTYQWYLDGVPIDGAQDLSYSILVNQLGDYTLKVSDSSAKACQILGPISISRSLNCDLDLGPDIAICADSSVTLNPSVTGSQGNLSYLWTPSVGLSDPTIANPVASPQSTTTYTLTITDQGGCIASDSVTVEVNEAPLLSIVRPEVCADIAEVQDLGVYQSSITNLAGTFEFFTTGNGRINDIANVSVLNGDVIDVIFTDSISGCRNNTQIVYNVFPLPVLDAGETTEICIGDTLQLNVSGAISFSWEADTTISDTLSASPLVFPLQTQLYRVTGTDENQCSTSDSVEVLVNSLPIVSVSGDTILCQGDSVQLEATGGLTYLWSPMTSLSNNNEAIVQAFPQDTTVYFVSGTDANNCVGSDSIQIIVHSLPEVDAGPDLEMCQGDSVQILAATNSPGFSWTPAGSLTDLTALQPYSIATSDAEYFLTVEDDQNCVNQDTVKVTVHPLPDLSLSESIAICIGESAMLEAFHSPNSMIIWNTGDTTDVLEVMPPMDAEYWVRASSDKGCFSDTARVQVEVVPWPEAAFVPDETEGYELVEVLFDNQSENAARYKWNFGDGNTSISFTPNHAYETPGVFTVSLVAFNSLDCTDTATYSYINVRSAKIFIPNGFSPNDDGINDKFVIVAPGMVDINYKIFTQWGHLIFEGIGNDVAWTGNYLGNPLPEGIYMVRVEAISTTGRTWVETSTITILR